jgi:hypothetical protein
MANLIADDVVAIKARLDEIEREKVAARAKQDRAADDTFEHSPFLMPVPDISDIYC